MTRSFKNFSLSKEQRKFTSKCSEKREAIDLEARKGLLGQLLERNFIPHLESDF